MPARVRGQGAAAAAQQQPPGDAEAALAALTAAIQAAEQLNVEPAAIQAMMAGHAALNAQGGAGALNQPAAPAQPPARTKWDSLARHDGTNRGHREWIEALESTLYQNGAEAQEFLARAQIADGGQDPQVNTPGYDSPIRRSASPWGHIRASLERDTQTNKQRLRTRGVRNTSLSEVLRFAVDRARSRS